MGGVTRGLCFLGGGGWGDKEWLRLEEFKLTKVLLWVNLKFLDLGVVG